MFELKKMLIDCLFFCVRYAMEVHIVHYKREYGSFKNAQSYSDGVCVVGFFGEVINFKINILLMGKNI